MSKRDRRTDPTPPPTFAITDVYTSGPSGVRHVSLADAPIVVRSDDAITVSPRPEGGLRVDIRSPAPPIGAWWNNLRRAWMTGPADAPVLVDPQPPAPTIAHHPGAALVLHSGTVSQVPPSVKVSA